MKLAYILGALLLLAIGFVHADSGAIWTTNGDCGDENQDVNHYAIGDTVYINGDNFDADDYNWDITGQPGGASCDPHIQVAGDTVTVDESGAFCFNAYTVQDDDCGEYKASVENKHDNYRVDENEIPEFGFAAAGLALVGAMLGLFYLRK